MIRMRALGAAVLSMTLFALSACGGDDTPSEETKNGKADTVSQDEKAASDNIDKYFELIGQNTEKSFADAAALAAPDSVAFAYATYLAEGAATENADGIVSEPEKYPKTKKGFKICDLDGDGDSSDCSYYSDFETTGGKIASFSANDISLKGRIVLGTGDPITAGDLATVRFQSAYQSPFSNTLFVHIEVKSKDQAIATGVGSADYRRPNGRQVTSAEYSGDYEVGEDSLVTNTLSFPGSEIGGEVSFDITDTNYDEIIPIKFKTK